MVRSPRPAGNSATPCAPTTSSTSRAARPPASPRSGTRPRPARRARRSTAPCPASGPYPHPVRARGRCPAPWRWPHPRRPAGTRSAPCGRTCDRGRAGRRPRRPPTPPGSGPTTRCARPGRGWRRSGCPRGRSAPSPGERPASRRCRALCQLRARNSHAGSAAVASPSSAQLGARLSGRGLIRLTRSGSALSSCPTSSPCPASAPRAEQLAQLGRGQLGEPALAVPTTSSASARFDRSARRSAPRRVPWQDELVDLHGAALADPEGAVRGLLLDGRVPPAVEVDDVLRAVRLSPCRPP